MPTHTLSATRTDRPGGAWATPFFWIDIGSRLLAFAMILGTGLLWGDTTDGRAMPGAGDVMDRIGHALSTTILSATGGIPLP